MRFVYDDGGRKAAGFRGEAGDCVCRAVAIATGRQYREVYDELHGLCAAERPTRRETLREYATGRRRRSSPRLGVAKRTTRQYLASLGWRWVPTMGIGTGCRVHLRGGELPDGRVIVKLSGHVAAVIDGVLRDAYDCSRGGTRCVYGYWTLA